MRFLFNHCFIVFTFCSPLLLNGQSTSEFELFDDFQTIGFVSNNQLRNSSSNVDNFIESLKQEIALAYYERDTAAIRFDNTQIEQKEESWYLLTSFKKQQDDILIKIRLLKKGEELKLSKAHLAEVCHCTGCHELHIDSIDRVCSGINSKTKKKMSSTNYRLISTLY